MVCFFLETTLEAILQLVDFRNIHYINNIYPEITFSQDLTVDVNNVNKKHYPKIHHFYIGLVEGNDFAVEIKGEKDKMIYHNSAGSLLNTGTKTIIPIVSLKKGDVLGYITAFFYENEDFGGYRRHKGYFSISQFLINGKVVGKQIRIDGETVTLTIFKIPYVTQIQTSTSPHQLNKIMGNVS